MKMAETIKKNDYVELKYTGYSNNKVFDSNIKEDLKSLNEKAEPVKTIIIVGQGMVVKGFDSALEGKETGKEYEVELKPEQAFGDRKRDLVKIIPLKLFKEKNVYPQLGMTLALDDMLAKIISISGARVLTDFNNPLAGKDIKYKFNIVRRVDDEKEKVETVFGLLFRAIPNYEIKDKIIVKGPKQMELFINAFKEKFKELVGKELGFEEMKSEKKTENAEKKVEKAEIKEETKEVKA
jgi:FKBP-type peptidyl-prolyl cis-trans isomerase SlyD